MLRNIFASPFILRTNGGKANNSGEQIMHICLIYGLVIRDVQSHGQQRL